MPNGNLRRVILALLFVFGITVALKAAPAPGSSAKYPISFTHLAAWLKDPRHSLNLFEETLKTDMLALRYNNYWYDKPSYVLWENGAVYEANIHHMTFQAMLWGPLFTTAVWEVPMLMGDALLVLGGEDPFLYEIPIMVLEASINVHQEQAKEKVPVSGLFRINILFTSDLLYLELKRFGDTSYARTDEAVMGNTYAGLAFKFLESNYFFAGFNFLHVPHISGWEDFLTKSDGFRDIEGIPTYSDGSVLYETRARLFLYNNLLDIVQIKALLNLAGSELFDALGFGFKFDIAEMLRFEPIVSYLALLGKWSLDFNTLLRLDDALHLTYTHHFAVKPFVPFDYIKAGAIINLIMDQDQFGMTAFQISGHAVSWKDDARGRQYGATWDVGFEFPLSLRIKFGMSFNMDDTMLLVPFASNEKLYFLKLEIAMDNNLDYQFNLRPRRAQR